MRKMFRLFFVLFLFLGLGYLLMAYQVVKTQDGIQISKKKEFGFAKPFIEKRETNIVDFVKEKISDMDWKNLKKDAARTWRGLSDRMDDFYKDHDLDRATDSVKNKMRDLRSKAEKKYQDLVAGLENQEISFDQFQNQIKKLRAWLDEKLAGLRAKL